MYRFGSDAAFGRAVAGRMAEFLREEPRGLYSIAAGTTSLPVFEALLELQERGALSFREAAFMGMDEWLGVDQRADGAMAAFLRENFLDRAGFREVFLFDGMAEGEAECRRAEQFLGSHGGLQCIVFGIGVNGHVALNEPGCAADARTHVANIQSTTATVAKKYFCNAVPELKLGVTLGLQNAAEARHVLLTANTASKRPAVERILALRAEGRADTSVPSAVIDQLPQAELYVTDSVFQ